MSGKQQIDFHRYNFLRWFQFAEEEFGKRGRKTISMIKIVIAMLVVSIIIGIIFSVILMIEKPFTLLRLGESIGINGIALGWIIGISAGILVGAISTISYVVKTQAKIRRAFSGVWDATITSRGFIFDEVIVWGANRAQNQAWGTLGYAPAAITCLVGVRINNFNTGPRGPS